MSLEHSPTPENLGLANQAQLNVIHSAVTQHRNPWQTSSTNATTGTDTEVRDVAQPTREEYSAIIQKRSGKHSNAKQATQRGSRQPVSPTLDSLEPEHVLLPQCVSKVYFSLRNIDEKFTHLRALRSAEQSYLLPVVMWARGHAWHKHVDGANFLLTLAMVCMQTTRTTLVPGSKSGRLIVNERTPVTPANYSCLPPCTRTWVARIFR